MALSGIEVHGTVDQRVAVVVCCRIATLCSQVLIAKLI
jgi:hypothetical protein